MNIQAIDGKWYIDPCWDGPNFRVYTGIDSDDVILNYRGSVLWDTARRVLAKLGIKAKLYEMKPPGYILLKGRLLKSTLFGLKLTRPIPVPHAHGGFFDEAPNPLFNGRTLSWKASGKRWIPIGPT